MKIKFKLKKLVSPEASFFLLRKIPFEIQYNIVWGIKEKVEAKVKEPKRIRE